MKFTKLKKFCTIAMTVAIGASLAACGGDASSASAGKEGKKLIYNLGADPKTLDPALNEEVQAGTAISNSFEGLMRLNADDKAEPGVAEKYDLSEDKLVYTFHLRDNAKWSDGKAVTADDFAYAWQRALDPKTGSAYAYQLYYIKGAEAFNKKKGEAKDLGIKVIDEKTLEVTLENPTPYFPELMAFPTYMPVRKDIVDGNESWATKPETYISNGPFQLKEWRQKDALVYEKNENYWNKDSVKLDTLEMRMIADENSAYSSFKAGEIHMVDTIPSAEIAGAVKEGVGKIYPQLGTYYYSINVTGNSMSPEALRNPDVTKALNLAIDREAIVKNVTKGEQVPATSFVPESVKDSQGKTFSKKEYFPAKGNVEEAKKLLAKAGYPDGKGLPTITLMFNTEGAHSEIAQAIQGMWKKIGVNVELKNEEWKVFQSTRNNKNYQIARHGWIGDYVDPMTFLDLFVTGTGTNDAGYSNPKYDELIAKAKVEVDSAKRDQYLKDAEEILLNDMPIIPLYYYTQPKSIQKNVKGVRVSQLGFVFFDKADVE